jgi:hypothetical protein
MSSFDHGAPLYATIAASGGLFTLTYRPQGSVGSAYRQGYDMSTFNEARGTGIPCVDFQTMDFAGYRFPGVKEAHSCFNERYLTLEQYVEQARERGATITML